LNKHLPQFGPGQFSNAGKAYGVDLRVDHPFVLIGPAFGGEAAEMPPPIGAAPADNPGGVVVSFIF